VAWETPEVCTLGGFLRMTAMIRRPASSKHELTRTVRGHIVFGVGTRKE